jgi:hypothetical protein
LCFIGFYIGFFEFFVNASGKTLIFEKSLIFCFFCLKLNSKESVARAGWLAGWLLGWLDCFSIIV